MPAHPHLGYINPGEQRLTLFTVVRDEQDGRTLLTPDFAPFQLPVCSRRT